MLFFFDTSALAKRFHLELGSRAVGEIFGRLGNRIFTSRLGLLELTSVAAIKVRTGAIRAEDLIAYHAAVDESARSYRFIVQRLIEADYDRAQVILSQYAHQHSLRTLDSLHLASALRLRTRVHVDFFVTSDRTLAKVAALEGFAIINPEEA